MRSRWSGSSRPAGTPTDHLLYKAVVERVVDGDTLEVRIDLGFDVWKVDKIRLRGIDTPELKMAKGKEAKAHVEELMEGLPFVVLRTYQTDRYARYVADLFYHPTLTTKESVFEKGFFLNQELVDSGMAVFAK